MCSKSELLIHATPTHTYHQHENCRRQQQTINCNLQTTQQTPKKHKMSAVRFKCGICFEEHGFVDLVQVNEDRCCASCFNEHVKAKFLDAVRFEYAYPVRWGKTLLQPDKFTQHLPPRFMQSWLEREKEYNTLPAERVLCKHRHAAGDPAALPVEQMDSTGRQGTEECNHFLGSRAETAGQTLSCTACRGLTCGNCVEAVYGEEREHSCQIEKSRISSSDTFKGLTKGRDLQLCPGCGLRVTIGSGCNHMTCTVAACRTEFCWICGVEARKGSGHWNYGQPCPMWNQPGARNALQLALPDQQGEAAVANAVHVPGQQGQAAADPYNFFNYLDQAQRQRNPAGGGMIPGIYREADVQIARRAAHAAGRLANGVPLAALELRDYRARNTGDWLERAAAFSAGPARHSGNVFGGQEEYRAQQRDERLAAISWLVVILLISHFFWSRLGLE